MACFNKILGPNGLMCMLWQVGRCHLLDSSYNEGGVAGGWRWEVGPRNWWEMGGWPPK